MSRTIPPRRHAHVGAACLVALCAFAGCAVSPSSTAPRAEGPGALRGSPDGAARMRGPGEAGRGTVTPPASDVQLWRRLEANLAGWEDARGSARPEEADGYAWQLTQDVDANRPLLDTAAAGHVGKAQQALSLAVLGFATDPSATQLLVRGLTINDPRMVGNALIALGVRRDPDTPLGPVLAYCARNRPAEVRRYAPLVLAHVLEARRELGQGLDVQGKRDALARLADLVGDPDPVVRLHTMRALGALDASGATEYLVEGLDDDHVRVRYAAAAALERSGDPAGFERVIVLLTKSPPDAKPMVVDLLASYAERLQGAPLSAEVRAGLGTHPRGWLQWFDAWRASTVTSPR
ncbi:MAG: HEAT repeat domain-containing protein [Planctomycetota bacterium]